MAALNDDTVDKGNWERLEHEADWTQASEQNSEMHKLFPPQRAYHSRKWGKCADLLGSWAGDLNVCPPCLF